MWFDPASGCVSKKPSDFKIPLVEASQLDPRVQGLGLPDALYAFNLDMVHEKSLKDADVKSIGIAGNNVKVVWENEMQPGVIWSRTIWFDESQGFSGVRILDQSKLPKNQLDKTLGLASGSALVTH